MAHIVLDTPIRKQIGMNAAAPAAGNSSKQHPHSHSQPIIPTAPTNPSLVASKSINPSILVPRHPAVEPDPFIGARHTRMHAAWQRIQNSLRPGAEPGGASSKHSRPNSRQSERNTSVPKLWTIHRMTQAIYQWAASRTGLTGARLRAPHGARAAVAATMSPPREVPACGDPHRSPPRRRERPYLFSSIWSWHWSP